MVGEWTGEETELFDIAQSASEIADDECRHGRGFVPRHLEACWGHACSCSSAFLMLWFSFPKTRLASFLPLSSLGSNVILVHTPTALMKTESFHECCPHSPTSLPQFCFIFRHSPPSHILNNVLHFLFHVFILPPTRCSSITTA